MTTATAATMIGRAAHLTMVRGLTIAVRCEDHKTAWGKDRYLVSPVSGGGSIWVEESNLLFVETR